MPNYVFNKSKNDGKFHEVHTTDCKWIPALYNRYDLGWHSNCLSAIQRAKAVTGDNDFDGCKHCCPNCHTG